MDLVQLNAITDIDALRALVADKIVEIGKRDRELVYKAAKIDQLTREILRLRRVQFAARSEKLDPEQLGLLEDAINADIAVIEGELEALDTLVSQQIERERSKPKRCILPPELPRIETRHEPASCDCAECGASLVLIGEHVSEKLDCKPLEFFVQRDVYPQYACRACQTVSAEPVAPSIIDRGQAAPGLLAQVVTAKYVDHLPLYRQEAIYARSGIELGRSTMAEWIGAIGAALAPLTAALRAELLAQPVLHADETPMAQLDPGAGKTKRAYLFAYGSVGCAVASRSATVAPIVLFDYCPSRGGKHAQTFLGDWRGALMVDDFPGYKALFAQGVTELGCWAHARRKFFDLYAANKSAIAIDALQRIAALYTIEQTAKDFDAKARYDYRQQHAKPRLDALHAWLQDLRPKVLGASGTLSAIDYTLRRWAALIRYLDDGRYPIDNNPIENAIRPIAIGRKNWLFAGSESAGKRAAAIMSLLATAKANDHDPHAWLTDVLTRLPTTLDRDLDSLLPHRWTPAA